MYTERYKSIHILKIKHDILWTNYHAYKFEQNFYEVTYLYYSYYSYYFSN